MKTRHYKTLKGLLRQTNYGQLNFIELKTRTFWHKTLGTIHFELDDAERGKLYREMAAVIYSRNVEDGAQRMMLYRGKMYGILERLRTGKFGAEYCAGQDYDLEVKTIQKILGKG